MTKAEALRTHPSAAAVLAGCECSDCHPSEAAYSAGCKCDPCMRRRMRVRKRHHIRAAQGPVMVSPDMTRINQLISEGFGVDLLADVLGVSDNTIIGLLNGGRTDRDRARGIRSITRSEILAAAPENAHVPPVGARRRIHALMRLGWAQLDIAGGNRSTLRVIQSVCSGGGRYVLAGTHRMIVARFDALGMTVGPSVVVRRMAERRGYPPPLAWDDDSIDDPAAQPDTDGPHPRMKLYEQGMSDRQIAAVEGVGHDTIRLWRNKHQLPPYYRRPNVDDRRALWDQGLTDQEIGDRVSRHPDAIRRWRKRNGLESRAGRKAS